MHAAAGLHPTDSPLFIPLTWGLARTDHANSTVYCCLRGRPFTVGVRLVADWITCIRFRAVLSTGELAAASTTSIFSVAHGTPKRHVRCFLCAKPALAQCPRYVAASLRVVHSVGISPQHGIGRSCRPLPCPRPLGVPFPGGKSGALGHPQPVRGNPHRHGHGPTALRLVFPCDTDSEKRAVSAARGSGEGIEGCADGAMWPVSLQWELQWWEIKTYILIGQKLNLMGEGRKKGGASGPTSPH